MSAQRRIPASGINLFQLIYQLIGEYESRTGKRALNLSLGNPDLIPPARVLELKALFAERPELAMHTYAENDNINQFAQGMVREFVGLNLQDYPELRAVPIPGIKTTTAILPLACGLHLKNQKSEFEVITNLPAYDVMGTWGQVYLGGRRVVWPLAVEQGMSLEVAKLEEICTREQLRGPDLVFVIRPGNPASRGATESEWRELIAFCIQRGSRLVNDGAYTTIRDFNPSTGEGHVPLAQIACQYPELEWIELLSVSKALSDPGARLGVAVGSRAFIEDLVLIKGNTESGPVPHVMAAYGELFQDSQETQSLLKGVARVYQERLLFLKELIRSSGLKPACETTAGFFTLWQVPREVLGKNLEQEAATRKISIAEAYNRLVIDELGLVGVHFHSPTQAHPPLIRYAACFDVLEPGRKSALIDAFSRLKPVY